MSNKNSRVCETEKYGRIIVRVQEWLKIDLQDRRESYHPDEWVTIEEAVESILVDHYTEWTYPLEEMQSWGGDFGKLMNN